MFVVHRESLMKRPVCK